MKAVQGFETEQQKDRRWKCCINNDSISKSANNSKKSMVKNNLDEPTKYFMQVPAVKATKGKVLNQHSKYTKEFEDVFNVIWCFKGTFSLQLKTNSNPYQVPP